MSDINRVCRRYLAWSLYLIFQISLLAYMAELLEIVADIVVPMAVGAVFSLVVEVADVTVWRKVAQNSPSNLPTFYTAVSGFRMLLALATMFVYYLVVGRAGMLTFVILFLIYYFVLLAHHAIFFSRVVQGRG